MLLQVFHRMRQWKKFENRPIFGEGMDKRNGWRLTFFAHSLDLTNVRHEKLSIINALYISSNILINIFKNGLNRSIKVTKN